MFFDSVSHFAATWGPSDKYVEESELRAALGCVSAGVVPLASLSCKKRLKV